MAAATATAGRSIVIMRARWGLSRAAVADLSLLAGGLTAGWGVRERTQSALGTQLHRMAAQCSSWPITYLPVCTPLGVLLQRNRTQSRDATENRREEPPWNRNLSHLKCHVSGMAHDLRTDLDQLLPERGE